MTPISSYYTLGAMCETTALRFDGGQLTTITFRMLFLSAIRVFALPMDESPKFLVSIGRDREAVEVVHRIAKANGTVSTLTVEDLHNAAKPFFRAEGDGEQAVTKFSTWSVMLGKVSQSSLADRQCLHRRELIKNSMSDMDGEHLKGLFATPRLAYSTSLIIFICASATRHPGFRLTQSDPDGALGLACNASLFLLFSAGLMSIRRSPF